MAYQPRGPPRRGPMKKIKKGNKKIPGVPMRPPPNPMGTGGRSSGRGLNLSPAGNYGSPDPVVSVNTGIQQPYENPRKPAESVWAVVPEHVARGGREDIDWRMCKVAWILNQVANVPYIITLSMCFTTQRTFQTKPLFDSKHVTMFVWAMGMIIVNTWITGSVIWTRANRTVRRIAWAQGAAFMVMNLSLMMVVHNGTFVSLETTGIEFIRWNTFYAGPPEVASQLVLFVSICGLLNPRKCCSKSQVV